MNKITLMTISGQTYSQIKDFDITSPIMLQIYFVILLMVILGLFLARQKKSGTCNPIRTLLTNSIISFFSLITCFEYFDTLAQLELTGILLLSFFVGMCSDSISNAIITIIDGVNFNKVIYRLLGSLLDNKSEEDE